MRAGTRNVFRRTPEGARTQVRKAPAQPKHGRVRSLPENRSDSCGVSTHTRATAQGHLRPKFGDGRLRFGLWRPERPKAKPKVRQAREAAVQADERRVRMKAAIAAVVPALHIAGCHQCAHGDGCDFYDRIVRERAANAMAEVEPDPS